jgi:hypothetical protein
MKTMKRFLASIIMVAMILQLIPVGLLSFAVESNAYTQLTSVPDGYIGVYTKQDLNNVRNNLARQYILMNNIEFTDADFASGGAFYNNGAGWSPIGTSDSIAFTGIFDGNAYVIKSIKIKINITSNSEVYAGLFGYNKGTIKNLGMVDGSVSGSSNYFAYTGGIVGINNSGTISDCYNTGSVSSSSGYQDAYSGGIVGINNSGTISDCYNTGSVRARGYKAYSGGIVGYNGSGTISDCYNTGSVSATSSSSYVYTGGIVGRNNCGTISNCYDTGSVSGYNTGGIVGHNDTGAISNCYNTGNVSGYNAGGIVGKNVSGTISNCYYLSIILKGVGNGTDITTKLTLEQMKQQNFYVGFDFDGVWQINTTTNYNFPILRNVIHVEEDENNTDFNGGNGTTYNPYKISTKEHLNNIGKYLNSSYILLNSIEFTVADFASGGAFYNNDAGWSPIGTSDSNAFTGIFEGNGYVIKNIRINITRASSVYAGLFGYNTGTIKNLGMIDESVSANSSLTSSSSSSSSHVYAGGIAGYNRNGTISNCYNTGSVSTNVSISGLNYAYAGGIVGENYFGTISNCYNTGSVSGRKIYFSSGGIVGRNYYGTISNSYNTGSVSGYNAGGIVGSNNYDINSNQNGLSNCYYLDIISRGFSAGWFTATDTTTKLTLEQMKKQNFYVGFDFDGVWQMNTTTNYNFPTLRNVNHIEKDENNTDFNGGNGTGHNPYKVSTKVQLNNIRNSLSSSYILLNDIEFTDADFASGGAFYNNGAGWAPIGTSNTDGFTGIFDGNGYAIKNIRINITSTSSVDASLFRYNTGAIKNIGMVDGSVSVISNSNYAFTGGIVAYNSYGGTISNCYNTGSVSASSKYACAGGIVGSNNGGTISNCYNTGGISASANLSSRASVANAGGIVGRNDGGTISNCYNTGSVSANANVISSSSSDSNFACAGGIVGSGGATISNCYNIGSVSASTSSSWYSSESNAGGIVGRSDGETISKCYNIGDVSAISSSSNVVYSGGIVGYSSSTISNCYNTGSVNTSSRSSYAGGIAGYNYCATISNCYNTGSVSANDVGGIVGRNYSDIITDKYGTIKNCYNAGSVSLTNPSSGYVYAGGILGSDYSNEYGREHGIISNCYYLDIILIGVGKGTGTLTKLTSEQMKLQNSFVGFDFQTIWKMPTNNFPELRSFGLPNKTELEATISTANSRVETNYTLSSWSAFKTSLDNANLVNDNIDATQAGVDSANSNLQTAINALQLLGVKTHLIALIDTLPKEKGEFNNRTWTALQSALAAANIVVSDSDASQNDVDLAKTNLQKAKSGLSTAIVEFADSNMNIVKTEGGYAKGIEVAKTASEIKSSFYEGTEMYVKIYDNKTGALINETDKVGTGCKIKFEVDGEIKEEATVVITGDVKGDGEINSDDVLLILNMMLKGVNLTDEYLAAANTKNDGDINSDDILLILNFMLKGSKFPT